MLSVGVCGIFCAIRDTSNKNTMSEEMSSGKSPAEGDQFVRRLCGLPIMATAIGQLSSFYAGTKERNRLLKYTLETAESGVGAIVNTAVPVVARFDKEIVALNYIACAQLDLLEDRCPIITKPTDEVVKETKDLCCVAVQPIVNRVNSVKNYGYNKVSGIRTYTGEKINGMKTYGLNTVSSAAKVGSGIRTYTGEKINGMKTYGLNTVSSAAKVGSDQMTRVLSTPVCRGVVNKFDLALDVADCYVDNYLPSECEVEAGANKSASSSDALLLSKAYQLGSKVQRRLYGRTMKRMRGVQLRARETIGQLNYTVDLIEYARSGYTGAHDKLQYYWQEINKMEDRVTEDAANEQIGYYDSNFERKAIATARQLTTKLKSAVSWVESSSVCAIPEAVRGRIGRLQEMAHSLSEVFSKEVIKVKGLPNSALDNARSTMVQLYASLSDLVEWTLKNSSNSSLISSFLGYGWSHSSARHSKKDLEMDVDSENQPKNECEATSDLEAVVDEEDHRYDTTGGHQRDEVEEYDEEEEMEDKEEDHTNRGTGDHDMAEQRQDEDERSNDRKNDEVREDENMEETENQFNEEDVEDQQTGVDEDKGKDADGCEDLQKEESQTQSYNEEEID